MCGGKIPKVNNGPWTPHGAPPRPKGKAHGPILWSPVCLKRRPRRNVSLDTQIWAQCAPPTTMKNHPRQTWVVG